MTTADAADAPVRAPGSRAGFSRAASALAAGLATLVAGCAAVALQPAPVTVVREVESFDAVDAAVERSTAAFGAQDVLVVLDIDNTILTSPSDLGGDIWYQWQTDKLSLRPTEEQRVKCLYEDAIGLLYELAPMRLTDPSLPELIRSWQDQGNVVFALTSRAPKYRAATEREIGRLGIDLSRSPLAPAAVPDPVYRETAAREWSYMRGIMMTTGMDKGVMLSMLLQRTGATFDAILFVDDTRKHIDAMLRAFGDSGPRELTLFHYTKVEAERVRQYGAVLTEAQANRMAEDWQTLQATLQAVFPARSIPEGCLGQ